MEDRRRTGSRRSEFAPINDDGGAVAPPAKQIKFTQKQATTIVPGVVHSKITVRSKITNQLGPRFNDETTTAGQMARIAPDETEIDGKHSQNPGIPKISGLLVNLGRTQMERANQTGKRIRKGTRARENPRELPTKPRPRQMVQAAALSLQGLSQEPTTEIAHQLRVAKFAMPHDTRASPSPERCRLLFRPTGGAMGPKLPALETK